MTKKKKKNRGNYDASQIIDSLHFQKRDSHCRKPFESYKWTIISLQFIRMRPFGQTSDPASTRQQNWP
jgi:hypothetical protein